MTSTQAVMAYVAKAGNKARPVGTLDSVTFVKNTNDRMATIKGVNGERLALVIETKKGFTIDLVKKLH